MKTPYIKSGYGFNVSHDFARATKDIPIRDIEFLGGKVRGKIDPIPESKLGFLRYGKEISIYTDICAIGGIEGE